LDAGVKVSVGTGAGQINASGGKVPATVAGADVSGNPSVNAAQFGGQAVALDANNLPKVDLEDWKGAVAPANTGDAYARIGAAGAGLTAVGDTPGTTTLLTSAAAIKAKTDNLPAAPSAVSDIPTAAVIVDKLLGRNLAGGADGTRTVRDALRALRNKVVIAAGTVTVYQEDGVTVAWTGALTQDGAAQPITSISPA
jgi:hypothetical protein